MFLSKSVLGLLFVLILLPSIGMAATQKKAVTTDEPAPSAGSSQGTLLNNKTIGAAALKGLSVFGSFDLTDTVDSKANGQTQTQNMEKTFGLGALYALPEVANGIFFQGGGTYEFGRDITPQNAPAQTLTMWTGFGEVAVLLTPQIQVMGGLNYNFPNLTNSAGTIKGKVGYQIGGSFIASNHFAIDARYRTLNAVTDVGGQTTDGKIQGLVLDGRYQF